MTSLPPPSPMPPAPGEAGSATPAPPTDVPASSAGRVATLPAIGPLRNPVLRRELVERVRGIKASLFVTGWLAFLTAILLLAYLGTLELSQNVGIDVGALGRVGREIFEWVLFGMLLLVLFLVPALTSGVITGERERQTLVPLQMTLMTPRKIVVGKLTAALSFLVLLLVTAMPLLATSLLVGGIGLFDIVRGVGMVLFTGTVLGAVCLWVSSRFRRTTAATVASYAVSLLFTVGSFAAMLAWAILDAAFGRGGDVPPAVLLAVNPFAGVGDALPRGAGEFGGDTNTAFGGLRTVIDDSGNFGERGPYVFVFYILFGLVLLALSLRSAARAVTVPAETER